MTEIKMTTEAIDKLKGLTSNGQQIVMDLDDGVGPFSAVGVCSLNTHFNMIIAPAGADLPDFNVALDSPAGPVLVKDYSQEYFGSEPKLDVGMGGIFSLSDESGLLDSTLGTIVVPEDAVLASKGQKGPAASC